MTQEILQHPFNNCGVAPFEYVGYAERLYYPCHNIDGSINNSVPPMAGGTCAHCGTCIRHAYIIRDKNGKEFDVGSECVAKAGLPPKILTAVKAEKNRQAAIKRQEKREADREARLQAQRDKNGGLTDWQLKQKQIDDEIQERKKRLAPIVAELKPYAESIRDGKQGFCDSIAETLERGDLPRGRGLYIMIDILAKSKGRGNSKAYNAEYENLENFFEKIDLAISKAKGETNA